MRPAPCSTCSHRIISTNTYRGSGAATDSGDDQPVFRQYRSGEGAFLASKPHNQLLNVTREDVSSHLDFLTTDALPPDTTATEWALNEASLVRRAIPGDRLLQRWIGQVVDVGDGWFTGNFTTTLAGEDSERATFQTEEALSESDQKRLEVGALVEWLVYESAGMRSPVRSRVFRIKQSTAAIQD